MSAATKRLLKELSSQYADPNPALDRLEPISEDDIFTWKAVLNGVHDSPYEGKIGLLLFPCLTIIAYLTNVFI